MHPRAFTSFTFVAIALSLLLAIIVTSGQAQAPAGLIGQPYAGAGVLTHHVAPQILDGTAVRVAHYDSQQKLRLALAIQPPHMAEEEQYINELQTKGSPNFHKFLTPEDWNARFAPSAEDEQKVVDWAQSQGLTVTNRFPHRLIVDLEGTVDTIEKAFGITINSYQVGGEVDFANDRDPLLPPSLQGLVYSVQGLNNIQRDRGSSPQSNKVKGADYVAGPGYALGGADHADGDSTKLPAAMVAKANLSLTPNVTNGYMDPTDIYSSQTYDYNGLQALGHCCNPYNYSTGSPNTSSIAIAAFGTFNGSDIAGFASTYPYLAYNYTYYNIDGTIDCSHGGCPSGETTQDLEWSIATSNSFGSYNTTAHVYVYIGVNENNLTFTDMYSQMLKDNTARVFTTSWSCTEFYGCAQGVMDARHSIFNSMVGQGWTLIAASGDRGATDDCNTSHIAVAYPASDWNFVAAGGTELSVYTNGNWNYEVAWSGGFNPPNPNANPPYPGSCGTNDGGSGGGFSAYYGIPGWQTPLSGSSYRLTPDLSLNADGVGQNLYINGGLNGDANGTSVSAPELAGFFAQENAYLSAIGNVCGSGGNSPCSPVGNPNPFVYAAGVYNDNAHNPFYDITSGCNSNNVTQAGGLPYYCAGTGYDQVTGWGSANMMQLAWAINWQLIPASGRPYVSFSGPATNTWYNTNQTVSWSVVDYAGGTYPGTGIAGFTQGWDSIPPDSSSKAHGGSGDSFYSGPQYPNAISGCLAFQANGCAGGVSQGCHVVHVEGWNNQGQTTGDSTYGPFCYDTVAPTISISNSPTQPASGFYNRSVTITLTTNDPGGSGASGIYRTYYAIDSAACYPGSLGGCSVYSGPFTISAQGQHYIYYMTEDNAGNFSTETYEWVSIDLTAPVTAISLSGTVSGSVYDSAVSVTLSATDNLSGVQATYYKLDGGAQTTYTGSPFVVSTIGTHTVQFWSVDSAGNVESTHTSTFTISSLTTTVLTASPSSIVVGQQVTMTATVTASLAGAGTPTGSVTFYNGATNLGSGTLSGGVATLKTTALPLGNLTLQAAYTGAGNYLASNSFPFNETVQTVAIPTFSPYTGTYSSGQKVTLSDTTAGVTIHYTINGGAAQVYTVPLVIKSTETIVAYATLGSATSGTDAAEYSISSSTPPPVFSPATGSYPSGTPITISDTATGAVIYYQINGGPSVRYTTPLTLTATETIQAAAVVGSVTSSITVVDYSLPSTVPAPTFSPVAGTYTGPTTITISDTATGAKIYYTLNGGPSNLYTGPFILSSSASVQASAVLNGKASPIVNAAYVIQ